MAEKTDFTDTIHCMSKSHCNTCRNLEGGREWRKNLMSLFVLPGDNVDFKCPYGKEWGEVVAPPQQTTVNGAASPRGSAPKTAGAPQTASGGCGCSRAAAAKKAARKK